MGLLKSFKGGQSYKVSVPSEYQDRLARVAALAHMRPEDLVAKSVDVYLNIKEAELSGKEFFAADKGETPVPVDLSS